ncbi:MAG: DNA cytosine methyltransferase, partial [Emcibacteraceae bacterium]|nr:DNA cytosine methyltransferase [Emcibacteraceae bacterium]
LTVRDAIWDMNGDGYNARRHNNKYDLKENAYATEMRDDVSWMSHEIAAINRGSSLANHTLRNHAEHIKQRFRIYQVLQKFGAPSKTLGIPAKDEFSDAEKDDFLNAALKAVKFPCKAPDGKLVASDLKELKCQIHELNTRKHSQRPLKADQPSPTVLSMPDDFVHPWKARTMTVREMARFQSFPDSFEFRSKETTGSHRRRFEVPQYTQVGNAVAPKMGYAAGKRIYDVLMQAELRHSNTDKLLSEQK